MSDLIVKYSTFNNEGTEIKHSCTIEEAANQLAKMDKLYNDQLKEIQELKKENERLTNEFRQIEEFNNSGRKP